MSQPHISLAAEKIGTFLGLPVTNSLLTSWVVTIILILFSLKATSKLSLIPSYFQQIAEIVIEGLYNIFKDVVGENNILKFFPLLATIFLYVIIGNWMGLLPGMGTIGFYQTFSKLNEAAPNIPAQVESNLNSVVFASSKSGVISTKLVPLFRGATADLNTTFALALIAVFAIQYYGIKALGTQYFKKFINISNPIMFFVGILEIISEISRIISFAFRLFGNIFAGEVLLTVIAFLIPVLAPIPFLGLEIFVGFIQALVFSMLTAVFLNMAVIAHDKH